MGTPAASPACTQSPRWTAEVTAGTVTNAHLCSRVPPAELLVVVPRHDRHGRVRGLRPDERCCPGRSRGTGGVSGGRGRVRVVSSGVSQAVAVRAVDDSPAVSILRRRLSRWGLYPMVAAGYLAGSVGLQHRMVGELATVTAGSVPADSALFAWWL